MVALAPLVLFLKLILWALTSFTSLAAFIIFRAVALLLVISIQLFRIPSLAIEGALQHIASLFRAGLECVLDVVRDGVVSLISSGVELVSCTATGSITFTTSAAMEMMEKMRSVVDVVGEIFPEVLEGVREMGWKVVMELWNNYRDAVGYIMDHVNN